MKISNKIILSTAILSVLSFANADFVGAVSKNNKGFQLEVGESNINGGPHHSGYAGIGLGHTLQGSLVDFSGLAGIIESETKNGIEIYKLIDPYGPDSHHGMGDFRFSQVGDADVWFGEWSQRGENGNDEFANRQVYYSGDHSNTTMPSAKNEDGTSRTAEYTVHGTNHVEIANFFVGTLVADFSANTLSGIMVDGFGWVKIDAQIKPEDASFDGAATSMRSSGESKGHFFGNQAASLAGIATFTDNPMLDTSFGGTKNP